MHNSFDNTNQVPANFDIRKLPTNVNERKHGFVCPWNIYQIITLIFFVSTILTTYFVIFPALLNYEATHTKLQYIIVPVAALLFLVISFTILSLAITTTTINPLDPLVLKQRYLRYNKIPIDAHKLQEGKPLELYC